MPPSRGYPTGLADMITQRLCVSLPTLSLSVLCGLALAGPGCTGFISGTDTDTNDETSGNGDGDGDPGDGDGDPGDGDGAPSGESTIYELQQEMVAQGTNVSLAGVVVTTPINTEYGIAFVEEPGAGEYSGIALYLWDEVVMAVQLAPGDVVDIVGEYTEYNGASQLIVKNPGDIQVVGSDAVPGPDVVDAATLARMNADAEPWEGVRVCVDNVAIGETNDGYGQYVLTSDTLIGHTFVDPLPQVQVGGTFTRICGSLDYGFSEYKIQPAAAGDLQGYVGPSASTTTIYDIQQGMVTLGSLVTVEDAIASSGLTWTDDNEAFFFMQDSGGGAYSGIAVKVLNIAGLDIEPGDTVTVTGTYKEDFGMSVIEVADAAGVMVGGNGPAPAPELIADPASIATNGQAAEQWEGVLVRVENVTVTDVNPDAPDEFGEFAVTGNLRVDDAFFAIADWTKPAMDQGYASITGPLAFTYDNFKLEPRDPADLVQQ